VVLSLLLAQGPLPAAVVFERAAEAMSRGDLAALGNLGVTYARMNREGEAMGAYRRALRVAPAEPGLLLSLGLLHLGREEYGAALPLIARVDRGRGATEQPRQLLATCVRFTGRAERALELLKGPKRTAEVLFLPGTAQPRLKRGEEARRDFEELMGAVLPEQAHFLMGRAYADNGQLEEVKGEFRQAPQLPAAKLELANALTSGRETEGAARVSGQ
jgi:Flp pilus assembly protein TadD